MCKYPFFLKKKSSSVLIVHFIFTSSTFSSKNLCKKLKMLELYRPRDLEAIVMKLKVNIIKGCVVDGDIPKLKILGLSYRYRKILDRSVTPKLSYKT